MGADIDVTITSQGAEMHGDVSVHGRTLKGTEIGGVEIPNLVDEVPILAVAAALADGRTVISDAAELRVKESDRLAAMASCLNSAGVSIEECDDGLIIYGNGTIAGGCEVDSCGDHRVAMAMAVAGLCAKDAVLINDVDCVLTSYPTFWTDMDRLAEGCRA